MIEKVIEQRRRNLGGGMEVGRVLPFAKQRMVGPFIFFDHMGPFDIAPGLDRSVTHHTLIQTSDNHPISSSGALR